MISDVVEDAEACLAMFSLHFGVLKVSFKLINTKTTEFSMCVRSPCQDDGVAWHSIGLQREWLVLLWIFWAMELKVMKKTCLERKGMPRLTQPMSVVVTATIRKKVLRR